MSDWKNVQYKDGKFKTNDGGSGSSGHTYSITEQDTGDIWVDGKHIYETTFILSSETTISNTSWTSIGVLASSINADAYIKCFALSSTGTLWDAMNVATINSYIALTSWRNGDTIAVKTVVLQYTKTTDV